MVRGHHLHPCFEGFFYLVAVMDWASRHVLSWQHDGQRLLHRCAGCTPEIFNTDQGARRLRAVGRSPSLAFTDRVRAAGALCSMDGRGRYLDNIFIERLWRSLKYEAVYLHELSDGHDAERVIGSWFGFYNDVRPHSSLDGRTPGDVYRGASGEAA